MTGSDRNRHYDFHHPGIAPDQYFGRSAVPAPIFLGSVAPSSALESAAALSRSANFWRRRGHRQRLHQIMREEQTEHRNSDSAPAPTPLSIRIAMVLSAT